MLGVRFGLVGVVTVTACLALTVAAADADVFAVVNVQPPGPTRTDRDIEIVNAASGTVVPLPAGVNTTTADEIHPSISTDGNRLVFERRDAAAGTVRIIVVDLGSGQSSDLFTGFESAVNPPTAPAITPNGKRVVTGGSFQSSATGFEAGVTLTALAPFPHGPYTHTFLNSRETFPVQGEVTNVAAGPDGLFALQADRPGFPDWLILIHNTAQGVSAAGPLTEDATAFGDPALAATSPAVVLLVTSPVEPDTPPLPRDIAFVPADLSQFDVPPTQLPAVVNPTDAADPVLHPDESQPALTADGRFVAFVRNSAVNDFRLFLWDSQTQLLVNPAGVDLGNISGTDPASVSLYERPGISGQVTMVHAAQGAVANVAAQLPHGSGLGILVQRIIGHHRVLGRRAFKLRMVGRVPLGHFKKGRHHLRWNLRVDGRRLKRGRYLVTLRTLSREGVVTFLATPDVLRVR